jgi:hypothetical protein
MGFTEIGGTARPNPLLRQVSAGKFRLEEGFEYAGPSGSWTVRPEDLPDTDLASIPTAFLWFASRYGDHTLAALLHDHLVKAGPGLDPAVPRRLADDIFLEALAELGVPPVRRRIMWSAVVLRTRFERPWLSGRVALMVLWVLTAVAGTAALAIGIAGETPWLIAAGFLGPLPAAFLWRKQALAGVVGGYAVPLLVPPALGTYAGYSVYRVLELVVGRQGRKPKQVEPAATPAQAPTYAEL